MVPWILYCNTPQRSLSHHPAPLRSLTSPWPACLRSSYLLLKFPFLSFTIEYPYFVESTEYSVFLYCSHNHMHLCLCNVTQYRSMSCQKNFSAKAFDPKVLVRGLSTEPRSDITNSKIKQSRGLHKMVHKTKSKRGIRNSPNNNAANRRGRSGRLANGPATPVPNVSTC
jgi:hypothetical protein